MARHREDRVRPPSRSPGREGRPPGERGHLARAATGVRRGGTQPAARAGAVSSRAAPSPCREKPARAPAGLLVVANGDLAVHQHETVALGPLDATPLASREVVPHLSGQHLQPFEVVDDDVGRRSLAEHPAPFETRDHRGQRREPPVRLLEAQHPVLAHDLAQRLGRIAPRGQELGVRPAVRHPEEDVGVVDDLAQVPDVAVRRGGEELGREIFLHRHVEHHVDRVLAHPLARDGEGVVLPLRVLLELRAHNHDVGERASRGDRHVVLQGLAPGGVGELSLPLLARAGGRLAPGLRVVEEVPVLEGEVEAGVGGETLADDPDPPHAAALQPREDPPVDVGAVIERLDDVHEHRPSARLRHLLVEGAVAPVVARDEEHLHEALVALGEHPGEGAAGVVVHDVGRHRGAVEVALHGGRPGREHALRGPAAAARVHRLVEQAAELGVLGVGRAPPRLRVLEPEDPDEERPDRDVGQEVDGLRRVLDRIEELGEGHPVPGHPLLHRREGDGLDPGHRQHRPLALLGTHRSEAEAAVADDRGGDPVPPGQGAVRVPEDLGVVVGVEVDEARGDVETLRVDDLPRLARRNSPDLGDEPVPDPDVRTIPRHPGPVEHGPAANDPIKGRHVFPPSSSFPRNPRSRPPPCHTLAP